jgi:hypothetical protein
MSDLLMVVLIAAGFAAAAGYARFCNRLARWPTDAGEEDR